MDSMITSVTTALQSQFSSAQLATIIVAVLGITVSLVLSWFAYRLITRKVQKAMTKGKL